MSLQLELREFLLKEGITPSFCPTVRGSKIVDFWVPPKQEEKVKSLLGKTFQDKRHRLTFSPAPYGRYCCNFQPLLR